MANRKKKKTLPKVPYTHKVTKSYFEHYSTIVRKFLAILKFDPDLFDEFTKRQKLEMMEVRLLPPRVSAQYNHDVPRQYVNYIKEEVSWFLKEYFGDPSLKLTYEDYVTVGISFVTHITRIEEEQGDNASEFVKDIAYIIHKLEEETTLVEGLLKFVQIHLFDVSKINIRLYGVKWGYKITSPKTFAGYIYITSMKPEVVNFSYYNKIRPAYRLAFGDVFSDSPIWFSVPYNSVITGSKEDRLLKIYVQSHAILRIKERLDTLIPFNRNAAILTSLVENKMIKTQKGQILFSFIDANDHLLGYMPFVIEGDSLFVLTFIPLSSPNAPEGNRLCKILNITKEDMEFLGMDKLSFYQNTDFDAIPNLKAALIEAGLWHLTEIEPEETIKDRPLVKSTGVIAKFFQEIKPESNNEDILSEVAKMYD